MTDFEFINNFDNNLGFTTKQLKAICHGCVGENHKEGMNNCGEFTRIFQVKGRWFRVCWIESLYYMTELCELQTNHEYIRSLDLDEFAKYLDKFGTYYKSRNNGIPLDEIKGMLSEYREYFR